MSTKYGVYLRGCSGKELVWVDTSSQARRIRRVLAHWQSIGGFSGRRTLEALANLALNMPGKHAKTITRQFQLNKQQNEVD